MVSHFFRALTGCRDPPDEACEQGLELPEAWWGTEPTVGAILLSLHAATEYDSAAGRGRERKGEKDWVKIQQLIMGYILSGQMLQTDFCTKMLFNFLC